MSVCHGGARHSSDFSLSLSLQPGAPAAPMSLHATINQSDTLLACALMHPLLGLSVWTFLAPMHARLLLGYASKHYFCTRGEVSSFNSCTHSWSRKLSIILPRCQEGSLPPPANGVPLCAVLTTPALCDYWSQDRPARERLPKLRDTPALAISLLNRGIARDAA